MNIRQSCVWLEWPTPGDRRQLDAVLGLTVNSRGFHCKLVCLSFPMPEAISAAQMVYWAITVVGAIRVRSGIVEPSRPLQFGFALQIDS